MNKNERCKPYANLPALEGADFCRDATYVFLGSGRLLDEATGKVAMMTELQRLRSDWYFQPLGFNPPPQQPVSLAETVKWAVRAYPGRDRGFYGDVIRDCPPPGLKKQRPTDDQVSSALSQDASIRMVDRDGCMVIGLGHNERGCTFWPKGGKALEAFAAYADAAE